MTIELTTLGDQSNKNTLDEEELFKVKCCKEHYSHLLSITHNSGRHWTSLSIENPLYEIPQIIAVLESYMIECKQNEMLCGSPD